MANYTVRIHEGMMTSGSARIVIVISRWNEFITKQLLDGALDSLRRHGVDAENVEVMWCPGSFEIPLVLQKALEGDRFQGAIALGAVIRGSTPHFDHVAGAVSNGVSRVALDTGKPIGFGVLTVDTIEQAIERSGTKAGNKGSEAALTLLEMLSLIHQITK